MKPTAKELEETANSFHLILPLVSKEGQKNYNLAIQALRRWARQLKQAKRK
jgi:hypothetical protein